MSVLLSSVLARSGSGGLVLEHAGRMLVRTGSRSRGAASQRLDAGLVRHLVVGGAGGYHRPHHRILPHAEVDQHRAVVYLVRLFDGGNRLFLGERDVYKRQDEKRDNSLARTRL